MIDLILISDGERQHYGWIKNMNRLVAKRTKNCQKSLICRWCLSHFTHQQEIHEKHIEMCQGLKKNPQADRMPSEKKGNNTYYFKNWKRRMPVPYYFTALNIPKEDKDGKDLNKKTNKVAEQIPCSYSYIKVRYDGATERQKIFVGENAAQNL
jgi:hypothetical protein